MIAIVTAGGIAGPGDPLYAESQGRPKALLDLAGKPMIQWVVEALHGASRVEHVVVVGLPPESGVKLGARTTIVPDQGGMVANILAGLQAVRGIEPAATHALLSSGDIPGITPAMVDWRVGTVEAAGADVDYAVVERTTMDRVFPGSRRSFTRLKGTEVCGGDLNGLSLKAGFDTALWDRLVAARKNALKQAAIVGFDVLLLALLGRLTLQAAEQRVGRNLGLKAHVTLCPYAEVGMDVDKPHQLAMLRRHLEARGDA
ncbi:MAG: acylneuraminate cytidylyltransferase [Chloroflexi bacterium]|nr:acylneuraminate cytidylyltransferase [Chloroflexota bacterium]